jgi:hypothetical protein
LATQRGRLAGGDPLGSDGIGKADSEIIDLTPLLGKQGLQLVDAPTLRN